MKDYFAILGLDKQADTEEVKKAYRRLAMLYHPDRNDAPDAELKFKEINEAYTVLSDPTLRGYYLQQLSYGFSYARHTHEAEEQARQQKEERERILRYREQQGHERAVRVNALINLTFQRLAVFNIVVAAILLINKYIILLKPYRFDFGQFLILYYTIVILLIQQVDSGRQQAVITLNIVNISMHVMACFYIPFWSLVTLVNIGVLFFVFFKKV